MSGALFAAMNGRDQLDTLWPDQFAAADNAERPSELLMQVKDGSNFGWPYCYHDFLQKKFVLAPEYGGDGKKTTRCEQVTPPVAAFPAHWAPVDLMFYRALNFRSAIRAARSSPSTVRGIALRSRRATT